MKMADARRHSQGGGAKHRHKVQVFRAILNHHAPVRKRLGKRRVDHKLRRRFVLDWLDRRRNEYVPGALNRRPRDSYRQCGGHQEHEL
jgi:hypothetical protein